MSLQPYQGNSVSFITTNNCTAACPHCVMRCSPGEKFALSFEQIKTTIDSILEKQKLQLVVFTGGEPTLLKDDLLRAIHYCHSHGILTRIVTNAHWANTAGNARKVLSALKQAGLDELNFSLDDYHAPYVPVQNVKNAWKATKGMGFLSVVIANSHGESDTITPEWIQQFFEETIQVRDPDHRHGYSDGREKKDADGTLYIITEARVQKTGRAAEMIKEEDFHEVPDQTSLNCSCGAVIIQPSVGYRNDLWACCGVNCEENEVLRLGDLNTESYESIMQRSCNSVLLNAIHYLGPYSLIKFVEEKDPGIHFSGNYHSMCEMCEVLTTNSDALKVLRANYAELTSWIVLQESVEKRNKMLSNSRLTRDKLQKFISVLKDLGYADFFTNHDPIANNPSKWPVSREKALPVLQPYIDLLLLGRSVEVSKLSDEFLSTIREIEDLGLFTFYNNNVIANRIVLHPVFGIWLFYELPNAGMTAYFGQDSVALLARQMPVRGQTCLDLCSGPGIQALYAAKQGEKIVSVEINPTAAALARINALMNKVDDRIQIRVGDLYAKIQEEEKFDRITANPPLLPFPEEMPYAFIGHGGDDGLKVTWRILEGIGAHLKENGTGQIIGIGLGNGNNPLFLEKMNEVAARSGINIRINIVNHISMKRGAPHFITMAQTSHMYCGKPMNEIEDAMEACFARQGAIEYLVFELLVQRGSGDVQVQDLTMPNNNTLWFL